MDGRQHQATPPARHQQPGILDGHEQRIESSFDAWRTKLGAKHEERQPFEPPNHLGDTVVDHRKDECAYLRESWSHYWISESLRTARWDRGGGGCNPLTGEEEVRAAAVAGDGDDVGEQAPDGLDDPGGADEPLVEMRRRRLHALHVLPVVPRRDTADGVADALAGPVDGHDGEHEAPVQLAGQTPEPAAGKEAPPPASRSAASSSSSS
uniref:Uncharacterized protein n=1 Tax=Oryza barthii TaxID=65489 RepID=A0A0D3FXJ5_9ORYZ